ncbi:MAG: 30S ribosomal protein S18 [Candidatus Shapirobacteria bacterium]|nr:30S ribosomal protein S18 [Candidatus Shapirobacteria bacterium]MDD4410335.1 30S ribosomal protein S18 [Candidatus Shapirobacteria bacterium]
MIKKSKKDNILAAKRRGREKGCSYCKTNTTPNWQEYEKMGEFLSARSRILGAQFSGVCAKHQRKLVKAIKQARHLALMPFTTQ